MPKEVVLTSCVPNCTAQVYYKYIYDDPTVFQAFHKKENQDDNAVVTNWSDGARKLTYNMPLQLPATAKRFVGVDNIQMVETQTITWNGQTSFTVVSTPSMNFPGSSKFTTSGEVTITDKIEGDCEVQCRVKCSAGLPWPIQVTVEAIMVEQAQAALQRFTDFCVQTAMQQISSGAGGGGAAGPLVAPSHHPAASVMGGDADSEVEFWDALDALSVASTAMEEVVREPEAYEDAVLHHLRRVSASAAHTSRCLERICQHLESIDKSLGGAGKWPSPAVAAAAAPAGVHILGSHAATAATRQWVLLGVAGALTCGTAFCYMRYHQLRRH